jgi:hypothetical protein
MSLFLKRAVSATSCKCNRPPENRPNGHCGQHYHTGMEIIMRRSLITSAFVAALAFCASGAAAQTNGWGGSQSQSLKGAGAPLVLIRGGGGGGHGGGGHGGGFGGGGHGMGGHGVHFGGGFGIFGSPFLRQWLRFGLLAEPSLSPVAVQLTHA